jgi:mRNA interferase RelE/StbE
MYRVELASRAERAFRNLPADVQRRLDPAIQGLGQSPRPPGCKKLSGEESLWRIRVGDYRIVYRVWDEEMLVLVVKVGHRRQIYRQQGLSLRWQAAELAGR